MTDALDEDGAYAAWRALADRTLKGAPFETLTSRTADGVTLQPLYPPDSVPAAELDWGARDRDRPWDVRALAAHPDLAGANRQALDDLGGGAHSVLLALDPAGRSGLACASAGALAAALAGVETDLAPVALDAGFQGPEAARWLSAAAKGGPAAPLAFHLDPLSAFAVAGESPGPMSGWIALAAATGAELAPVHPRASLFLASGAAVHEAGGSEAQELGFALAAAALYARALEAAGVQRRAALERIVLGLAADGRPLVTIAKLRAARLLWGRMAAAALGGASAGAPPRARIEARGSRRMLAAADAWNNLIRLAAAGFGAACGGADAVVLPPFTASEGGLPTPLARRQARNTQLVLMEEAGLGRVADPARGAGAVEALTDGIARAAWAELRRIEAEGGALEALRRGRLAEAVATARAAAKAEVAEGRAVLVGVTRFTNAADHGAPVEPWPQPEGPLPAPPRLEGPADRCPPLAPQRLAAAFEPARAA